MILKRRPEMKHVLRRRIAKKKNVGRRRRHAGKIAAKEDHVSDHGLILADAAALGRIAAAYASRWRITVRAADVEGAIVWSPAGVRGRDATSPAQRKRAIEAAMRWGDPMVESYTGDQLVWAAPLMLNARTIGGLVASVSQRAVFPENSCRSMLDLRAACTDLRLMAEGENLTNAALLEARRLEYLREQERAQAIAEFKVSPHDDIREMYLRQEPDLLAAIRRDDRNAARRIMNSMLVVMLHRAGESINLIKAFFMELVVSMCRTAVEAGGKPEELLGANFLSLQQLSQIESEEHLAPWLHRVLDHVMDLIGNLTGRPSMAPLSEALEFMRKNVAADISREDIARSAHLSPYHFSRIFRRHLGRTCIDMLNQMRADKAAELLVRTEDQLAAIAVDCGFQDQSYFTKVFRRYYGTTPMQYRRVQRPDLTPGVGPK
jgi:AraC-like DNA-binding protein